MSPYTGRLAPSPTGPLHLGHAATFLAAHHRAGAAQGTLLLRVDDLDMDAICCLRTLREAGTTPASLRRRAERSLHHNWSPNEVSL